MIHAVAQTCHICGRIGALSTNRVQPALKAGAYRFKQTRLKSLPVVGRFSVKCQMSTSAYGKEKLLDSSSQIGGLSIEMDSPPVLYIAKYDRLVDIGLLIFRDDVKNRMPCTVNSLPSSKKHMLERRTDLQEGISSTKLVTPSTLTQCKLDFVLSAVKGTKSYEALSEMLITQPNYLFKPKEVDQIKDDADKSASVPLESSVETPVEILNSYDQNSGTVSTSRNLAVASKNRWAVQDEEWAEERLDMSKLPTYYLMLSKSRLTALVAITSAAGFSMAPTAVFEPTTFVISTVGVALFSASANTLNQLLEVPFDSQMIRTRNRVLVKCLVTPRHALAFAASTAVGGCLLLGLYVNTVAMYLGIANLILYVCFYTPMKRITIANTWVGSIVGALPPLIGYTSATGGTLDYGAAIVAGILFSWQFPHFNSLSWNLRPDYSRAGYRMMSVTHPDLCKRVALRYSIACMGLCSIVAPLLEVTTPAFALESLPLNGVLTYLAFKFYRQSDSSSSRNLFRYTLIHLPLLMTLLYISKNRSSQKMENLSEDGGITKEGILARTFER